MIRFRAFRSLVWALLLQTWRSKPALFWNLVLPLFFLVGLAYVFGGGEPERVTRIVPGILTINLIAASFFGVALHMVSLREKQLYRGFVVTPVTALTVVLAHAVTALVNIIIAVILQLVVAALLFRVEIHGSVLEVAAVVLVAAFAMIPLGLLVGSVAQDMRTAPVISNVVFFVMMFLSGAAMPLYLMPSWCQRAAALLPATYVVELLQGVLLPGERSVGLAIPVGILILTGFIGFAFNAMLFRWEGREPINRWGLAMAVGGLAIVYLAAFTGNVRFQSADDPEATGVVAPSYPPPALASTNGMRPPPAVERGRATGRQVLTGMTIIDGDGGRIECGRVVIEGDRIVEVGPAIDGAREVLAVTELSGRYMIPGLIDSHVHLGGSAGGSATSVEFMPARVFHDLQVYLALGVTSFVSMTDDVDDMKSLRAAVVAGTMRAPRPFFSGPGLTAPNGHPARFFVFVPGMADRLTRQVDSPEAALAAVRGLSEIEVDVVKLFLDAGRIGEAYPVLTEPALRAAVRAAVELDLRTTVHVDTDRHARWAIDAGAQGLEHVPPDLSDETIALLVENGVTLTPTLTASEGLARVMAGLAPDDPLTLAWVDPEVIVSLESARSWIARVRKSPAAVAYYQERDEQARAAVRRAVAGGVTVLAGSDAGNPAAFHGVGLIRELELLVTEGGLTPAAALVAATGAAARRLRTEAVGRIAPGAYADFVILGADPERDIRALRDIRAVYFAGAELDRDTLLDTSPGDWWPQSGIEAD